MFSSLKSELEVCEEIGRGRFGRVFRCWCRESGEVYACKSIEKGALVDALERECLEKEPKILQYLGGHPNILQLHRVYQDSNYLHLVTQLCSAGDLYQRVSRGPLPEKSAAAILAQLLSAISHCHKHGVAHRDIKPDNIFFDSQENLKLADFGSAECFAGNRMTGVVGTPYYVAPEVLLGNDYNEKVDIWSAGVILYLMLSGVPPFYADTPAETFDAVLRGNLRFPTRIFRSVSPAAKDLVRKMICRDVSRRFSADQLLRHPWVISRGESMSMADLS